MGDERDNGKGAANAACMGPLWFIGWLFTIGFVKLTFWQGVLGLIIWPYYLGVALAG